jgi:hypothetical protein
MKYRVSVEMLGKWDQFTDVVSRRRIEEWWR